MARWLSFFAEYNFVVHYKPGKNNILADALSRQAIDDEDEDDDHCAVCIASGINLTNVWIYATRSSRRTLTTRSTPAL
ncbi:hypothetical protein PF002_g4963 [Phytophthora fragariae]|uniref:Reverse transcriptase RNase H-like domain-containing protein n=1 Tax=Phytophthora fragariae TaxID=53985 RepID=A0A6A4A2C8_9STRA|nr:hypothetical protein PF002_g4963 [Phytophthora fragariae]